MVEILKYIKNIFDSIVGLIKTLFTAILSLISLLGKVFAFVVNFIQLLPPALTVFIIAAIAISVIYLILGR